MRMRQPETLNALCNGVNDSIYFKTRSSRARTGGCAMNMLGGGRGPAAIAVLVAVAIVVAMIVLGVVDGPAAGASSVTAAGSTAPARAPATAPSCGVKPTIVLVHGAWADASSWSGEIDRLQRDGYVVRAIANPLRGLTSDAAEVADFPTTLSGPIVLVGHSYGGAGLPQDPPG